MSNETQAQIIKDCIVVLAQRAAKAEEGPVADNFSRAAAALVAVVYAFKETNSG